MPDQTNHVVLYGNLTRDPELRQVPSGTSVCNMRLANNRRAKINGEWGDKPNYFSITVWGKQGENCAQYLAKGRPVTVSGHLEWREWEAKDGAKRESIEIVADEVQFHWSRDQADGGGSQQRSSNANGTDLPVDVPDVEPSYGSTPAGEDDIPF